MPSSILIVGAERGLGLGLAQEFFRRGWSVTGPARPGADAEATNAELSAIMLTNAFGPMRLADHLVDRLAPHGGTLAFMSSHRGSITINLEGGLELYRASKAAQNMLARGLWAVHRDRGAAGLTVLSVHPGWVRTAMGTLDGTVEPEMELEPGVRGVADVVERRRGSGQNLYLDWRDTPLPW